MRLAQELTIMTAQPPNSNEAAARLLRALDTPDDLDCEQARALLPDLVDAEAAGVDVDTLPQYAALLRHLDTCADCMALYTELAADLEQMLGDAEPAAPLPAPPGLLAPARQAGGLVLRVLGRLRRAFELELPVMLPQPGTLSSASLFADTLPEVSGAPLFTLSLALGAGAVPDLIVSVGEAGAARWEVRVAAGAETRAATTDEQGIARFAGLALADGQLLRVTCEPQQGDA